MSWEIINNFPDCAEIELPKSFHKKQVLEDGYYIETIQIKNKEHYVLFKIVNDDIVYKKYAHDNLDDVKKEYNELLKEENNEN